MNTWQKYVELVSEGATQTAIAKETGIAQTSIGRWLNGSFRPTEAAKVAAFAKGYNRNVLEAFVAAGMLTASEAGAGLDDLSKTTLVKVGVKLSEPTPTLRSVARKKPKDPR